MRRFYRGALTRASRVLLEEAERFGEDLGTTDLEAELEVARVQLAEILSDEEAPVADRLKALEVVAKIARTARAIQEINAQALRQEFLEALLTAISHAFKEANALPTPEARAKKFIEELTTLFPARLNPPALLDEP